MSIVTIDDTNLMNIADAIREKNGTSNIYKPSEMASAIQSISAKEDLSNELNAQDTLLNNQTSKISVAINTLKNKTSGGNSEEMEAILTRTIANFSNDTLTFLGDYTFYKCTKLISVKLDKVIELGLSVFNACSSMVSFEAPLLEKFSTQAFYGCHALEAVNLPSVQSVGAQSFRTCKKLARVDLAVVTIIGPLAFNGCPLLSALIIRTPVLCQLDNISALTNTPIASGTGYIYVPDELVEDYKSATNWSDYASQIKPLSELEV